MSPVVTNVALTTLPASAFLWLAIRHLRGQTPGLASAGIVAGFVSVPLTILALFVVRKALPGEAIEGLFPLLLIPVVEEGGKLIAVRQADRYVAPDRFSTVVPLGILVGCVFGYLENLFYIWENAATSLLRGVSSLPLHMAATGVAALLIASRKSWRGLTGIVALAVAGALHVAHNSLWHFGGPLVGLAIVLAWVALAACVYGYRRLQQA